MQLCKQHLKQIKKKLQKRHGKLGELKLNEKKTERRSNSSASQFFFRFMRLVTNAGTEYNRLENTFSNVKNQIMFDKRFFLLFFVLFSSSLVFSQTSSPQFDLLITNARVVDGAGNPWFRADVAVKDGRIALIGRINPAQAKETIDAQNQILAPGFIDVHAHVENIFNLPEAENFVRMGVTSLVSGNCGGSPVDIEKYFANFADKPLAINLATLIGHNTVRGEVLKLENRAPTPEELERMKALVEKAMRDGAVGLSTGLIYVPGTYAKTDEVVELAKVAAKYGGIYATHMRDEGDEVVEAIKESIAIGEQAGLPVEISHFKISSKRLWGQNQTTLGLVREARAKGLPVTVDQYAYTASSTSLDVLLPDWALAGGREEGKKRLADVATREKIVKEMKENLKRSKFKDYEYGVVASHTAKPEYNGLNLKEITRRAKGKTKLDAQIEQIFEMYAAGGAQMVYHKMSEPDVEAFMREPFTMIASDSGVRRFGSGVPHPRGYGNNARVLAKYVRELKIITLEDAVRKMTSLPAQTFGLKDRGLIREGFAADLVLFDEKTIADRATFENPHQYATGISRVFVNGKAVFAEGKMTAARPGAPLKLNGGN
jgi:N-acyl-D-amino-acid deacylase